MQKKFFLLLIFLFQFLPFFAEAAPWGKDADIAKWEKVTTEKKEINAVCNTFLFGQIAEVGIAFHQNVISPADGPRSHFLPSSSQYTLDAMRSHGFFLGVAMGCDRLMRENNDPWVYRTSVNKSGKLMKLDPAPS